MYCFFCEDLSFHWDFAWFFQYCPKLLYLLVHSFFGFGLGLLTALPLVLFCFCYCTDFWVWVRLRLELGIKRLVRLLYLCLIKTVTVTFVYIILFIFFFNWVSDRDLWRSFEHRNKTKLNLVAIMKEVCCQKCWLFCYQGYMYRHIDVYMCLISLVG